MALVKTVVIIGSSRKNGNTKRVVDTLRTLLHFDIVDLNDFEIQHYSYEHAHSDDDFSRLIHSIIHNYDTFIFATPVYWYTMSSIMKVFFDRITDLLDIEKDVGRKLRKKNMAVITSSIGDHLGENFWLPFIATANYLGMKYLGNVHTVEGEDPTSILADFVAQLEKKAL